MKWFRASQQSRKWQILGLLCCMLTLIFGFQNCYSPLRSAQVPSSNSLPSEPDAEGATQACLQASHTSPQSTVGSVTGVRGSAVLQRDANGLWRGNVGLSPAKNANVKRILVTILNASGLVVSKRCVSELSANSEFSLIIPQGGPYNLVADGMNDRFQITQSWSLMDISVGEVFIIAGQSNAANHGDVMTSPQRLVKALNPQTGQWTRARDPQPGASDWSDFDLPTRPSGSPWPTFGDSLSESLNLPIGIISTAYGGTSISDWQKGSPEGHYARLMEAARLVEHEGRCGFRTVLWHQGESDAIEATSELNYRNLASRLLADFSNDSNCSQKWIFSIASYFPELPDSQMLAIRNAQISLATSGLIFRGPDTDTLGLNFRSNSDGVHWSLQGQQEFGRMMAQRALQYILNGP